MAQFCSLFLSEFPLTYLLLYCDYLSLSLPRDRRLYEGSNQTCLMIDCTPYDIPMPGTVQAPFKFWINELPGEHSALPTVDA